MDAFVSLSEPAIEENVTCPIGRDKAKTAARKGKGKEESNSQSGSFSAMGGIMSTLKKLAPCLIGRRCETSITSSAR
jgi:hypothetical protein